MSKRTDSSDEREFDRDADLELTAEDLEHVVGGLDRGWWPEANDAAGPNTVLESRTGDPQTCLP